MKKFLILALALMMVLALAACGDTGKTPSGTTDPSTSQQPSGGAQTQDEKDTAAFAQFGINIENVKAALDGEVHTYTVLKDPFGYGANAKWSVKPAASATADQQAAYFEQVYNAIKAIADDDAVHGSKTNQEFESVLSLDEAKGTWIWGYLYNGCYVDAYCEVSSDILSVQLVYAGQKQ